MCRLDVGAGQACVSWRHDKFKSGPSCTGLLLKLFGGPGDSVRITSAEVWKTQAPASRSSSIVRPTSGPPPFSREAPSGPSSPPRPAEDAVRAVAMGQDGVVSMILVGAGPTQAENGRNCHSLAAWDTRSAAVHSALMGHAPKLRLERAAARAYCFARACCHLDEGELEKTETGVP